MEFITLNDDFKERVESFSGTEAKLYVVDDMIYKIYINSSISSILHLMNLSLKQKNVKLTTFPKTAVLNDYNLLGIRMKFLKNYISFNQIAKLEDKLLSLKGALICLKELTDNFIYPLDLNSEGILKSDNDIQIIDLDTYTTKVLDNKDYDSLSFVIKLYRNIIFELLYKDFESITCLKHLRDFLESKKIDKSLIKDIVKENLTYSDLSNFISYYDEKNMV